MFRISPITVSRACFQVAMDGSIPHSLGSTYSLAVFAQEKDKLRTISDTHELLLGVHSEDGDATHITWWLR